MTNGASRLGRDEEAIARFERVLELRRGQVEAHNNLGNVLRMVGRQQEALVHLDQALALEPGNAEAHNNRGPMAESASAPRPAG